MRSILLIISFLSINCFGQDEVIHHQKHSIEISPAYQEILVLNYRSQIDRADYYFKDDQKIHSSIKPLITSAAGHFKSKLSPTLALKLQCN